MRHLRRLGCHIGRRGAFLLFLALLDVIVALSLTRPLPFGLTYPVVYGPMLEIAPINWWAGWWLLTGVLVGTAAAWHRIQPYAFGAAALIKTAWASCYVIGWVEGLPAYSRGYQTAAIFLAFAAVVLIVSGWRENGR